MSTLDDLAKLGFRRDTRAITEFQAAYSFPVAGLALKIDGLAGPLTRGAIAYSLANEGKISANFKLREFACKCGGRYRSCRRQAISRSLIWRLERLRFMHYPDGLSIVSGYRCYWHNRAVGGASSSQHLLGTAADIPPVVPFNRVASMWNEGNNTRLFGGIGYVQATGKVAHVDARSKNAVWVY